MHVNQIQYQLFIHIEEIMFYWNKNGAQME